MSGCMARLGQINRVKHIFDSTSLTIIVNALVFSKLYYCCNVWSNTSEYNLSRIQAVQNFAARIVSNSRKYDHISPILKDLKWLPVRQQLFYRHAIMAFKCMSGCAPASLFSKYIQRATITKRTTRNSHVCTCISVVTKGFHLSHLLWTAIMKQYCNFKFEGVLIFLWNCLLWL